MTVMTVGFGNIGRDAQADTRTRRALDALGDPNRLVTNLGVYIDKTGKIAIRIASPTITQTTSGLTLAQELRTTDSPTFGGLTLTGLTGLLRATAGVVSADTTVGTTLTSSVTSTGNTAGVDTNLFTYSVPASTLAATGDSLEFSVFGTSAALGSAQVKVKFGSTTFFDSGAMSNISTEWTLNGSIVRTGAATQIASAALLSGSNSTYTGYGTPAETLSGSVTLSIIGYHASANQVTGKYFKVTKQPG